jgi:hypothetical protein
MSASASVTARRIAAAALTAGALVSVVTLPASAADHPCPDRPKVPYLGRPARLPRP